MAERGEHAKLAQLQKLVFTQISMLVAKDNVASMQAMNGGSNMGMPFNQQQMFGQYFSQGFPQMQQNGFVKQ